ncbi:ImmA/IrrE family metallo-endopeptidase [Cohnella sp.]|uniref:ImmA/IrrE family metallo-endopeptidase n=1 Tax=Cohnella sp. TaxID=1883426 RepID=UPI00370469B7
MYNQLQTLAAHHGLYVYEKKFKSRSKGVIRGNIIGIDRGLTMVEKVCALAEECGHYFRTVGDITDQSRPENRKQERIGREWSYNYLIPLERIVESHKAHAEGRHEIADYLGVTEYFLQSTINRYLDKYGLFAHCNGYIISFEPLLVIDPIEI